jgi:ribonuclease BN (tRNA processing enzyme)
MKVDVIGSSGTYPVRGRPAAGFLITQGSTRVWCDAGPGTFTGIPIDSDLVDAVVVSHQHPDHCADLLIAFHGWNYRPNPRRGVPVYAPQATWDRLAGFLEKGPDSDLYDVFDFRPVWDGDEVEIGELSVSFSEMDHPVPTVGSRWEANNRTLFYTADTGPAGTWMEAARDVHVMLSEASYQGPTEEKEYPQHLTAGEAGRIAREVGASKLVLTHIPPYLDTARSVHEAEIAFDRPVQLAVPGGSFDV